MNPISQKVQQSKTDKEISSRVDWAVNLPDHTQLPDKDGNFCEKLPGTTSRRSAY